MAESTASLAHAADVVAESPSEPESPEADDDGAIAEDTSPSQVGDAGKRWSGWPGNNVFRLVVPVQKVGGIIGRKGELIKRICEETRARIRILDGPSDVPDRIVLICAKEEPDLELSPAMDGVLRVFKRVNGLLEDDGSAAPPLSSARLLVAESQAVNLIGRHGASIKAIQESSGAMIRVLSGEVLPSFAAADERIVDIQGDTYKVLNALESVVCHLRKFLVDQSIIPLFEASLQSKTTTASQDHLVDAWGGKSLSVHAAQPTKDYSFPMRHESLYMDRDNHLDSKFSQSGLPSYGHDATLSGLHSSLGRPIAAMVTKVTQTMQIPLAYAEDIIGVEGKNIAFIRRSSGAALTVTESRSCRNEIIVEIAGTSKEVQAAQQIIQDFMSGPKEPSLRSYSSFDSGRLPLSGSAYPTAMQSYGGGFGHSAYGDFGSGGGGGYRF